jgi:hypothetical protein
MAEMATYILFTVHTGTDDDNNDNDNDDDDTLIFYSIERRPRQNGVPDRHVGNKLSFQVN